MASQGGSAGRVRTSQVGKRNVKVSSSRCQRPRRCTSALEPVLEHCEYFGTSMDNMDCTQASIHGQWPAQDVVVVTPSCSKAGGTPALRVILSKLRDRYVKLMNEMAGSGTDLSGVSSFYGAHTGFHQPSARPSAAA